MLQIEAIFVISLQIRNFVCSF